MPLPTDFNNLLKTVLTRIYDQLGGDASTNYNDVVNLTHSTTPQQVKDAIASTYIYITDIMISTDSAGWVQVEDNTGTPVVLIPKLYLPANSVFAKSYKTPIKVPLGKKIMIDSSLSSGNLSVGVEGFTST